MNILILGANGMAGYGILGILKKSNKYNVYGTTRNKIISDNIITNVDADDLSKIESIIDDLRINCIINCIGLIKQKSYHTNLDFIRINSIFPHLLANICNKHRARLIHLSTDCVFDGSVGNYKETDTVSPKDIYSESKYCGEVYYDNTITIRTSIIGREIQSTKYSLVEWLLNNDAQSIKGYKNVIFSGFPVTVLAHIIKDHIIENTNLSGLYHIASEPITKYDLLNLISNQFHKNISIELDDKVWCNRSLNCDKFKSITQFKSQEWESMILDMYNDWNI